MFSRRDRGELAALGLTLLAWGLLVAPLAHSFTHAHGHRHSHGAPSNERSTPHAPLGSVEHLLAVATEASAVLEPVRIAVVMGRSDLELPSSPSLVRWAAVEQPQGP